ncbi:Na/Pi cotransporter family protein [Mongoliitalea daihaiensis]|uniref:Na/Pi cotransporter family protein n=1 Tax=Mongoliitalea daihaiensis TaxID=2782006 RepID=UPI001F305692|nr:Na/Pi symporter [Mongoliitalea daihaiensis]UJP64424.1 Na/Pi cotransporter family protein [Mongoliitalea daihaiensis]
MEPTVFDFWQFLAGIGLFLWGMHQLETAVKEMAGKSFRHLLQKFTNTPIKGISVGALITAILQSSSLVTLMVLAFLGAGVINLKNSLGVILGANLGTTATAWIVATLGFKFSVASFSMPFLGIGSLFFLFFSSRPLLRNIGMFSVGFGLLFLGLDFMKTSIEEVADQIDLQAFQSYGLWIYLLLGMVITALIQSSSAMIVIVLSAMSADIITLTAGVSMILGAKIGTTITVSIGSLGGNADKKRLALAHFTFNVVTGLVVFSFVEQLIALTSSIVEIKDPLMELVLLNSIISLIGILLFAPFLGPFEKWLTHRFSKDEPQGFSVYTKRVSVEVPEAAIAALEKDILFTYQKAINFISNVWRAGTPSKNNLSIWRKILLQPKDLHQSYQELKTLEDELTEYHLALLSQNLQPAEAQKLTSLMLTLRTLIYASKDLKDVMHNIREMEDSDNSLLMYFYKEIKSYSFDFMEELSRYMEHQEEITEFPKWLIHNEGVYNFWISDLYQRIQHEKMDYPISTLTNVMKQVISSMDNLSNAVIYWKHGEKEVIDN